MGGSSTYTRTRLHTKLSLRLVSPHGAMAIPMAYRAVGNAGTLLIVRTLTIYNAYACMRERDRMWELFSVAAAQMSRHASDSNDASVRKCVRVMRYMLLSAWHTHGFLIAWPLQNRSGSIFLRDCTIVQPRRDLVACGVSFPRWCRLPRVEWMR